MGFEIMSTCLGSGDAMLFKLGGMPVIDDAAGDEDKEVCARVSVMRCVFLSLLQYFVSM